MEFPLLVICYDFGMHQGTADFSHCPDPEKRWGGAGWGNHHSHQLRHILTLCVNSSLWFLQLFSLVASLCPLGEEVMAELAHRGMLYSCVGDQEAPHTPSVMGRGSTAWSDFREARTPAVCA